MFAHRQDGRRLLVPLAVLLAVAGFLLLVGEPFAVAAALASIAALLAVGLVLLKEHA